MSKFLCSCNKLILNPYETNIIKFIHKSKGTHKLFRRIVPIGSTEYNFINVFNKLDKLPELKTSSNYDKLFLILYDYFYKKGINKYFILERIDKIKKLNEIPSFYENKCSAYIDFIMWMQTYHYLNVITVTLIKCNNMLTYSNKHLGLITEMIKNCKNIVLPELIPYFETQCDVDIFLTKRPELLSSVISYCDEYIVKYLIKYIRDEHDIKNILSRQKELLSNMILECQDAHVIHLVKYIETTTQIKNFLNRRSDLLIDVINTCDRLLLYSISDFIKDDKEIEIYIKQKNDLLSYLIANCIPIYLPKLIKFIESEQQIDSCLKRDSNLLVQIIETCQHNLLPHLNKYLSNDQELYAYLNRKPKLTDKMIIDYFKNTILFGSDKYYYNILVSQLKINDYLTNEIIIKLFNYCRNNIDHCYLENDYFNQIYTLYNLIGLKTKSRIENLLLLFDNSICSLFLIDGLVNELATVPNKFYIISMYKISVTDEFLITHMKLNDLALYGDLTHNYTNVFNELIYKKEMCNYTNLSNILSKVKYLNIKSKTIIKNLLNKTTYYIYVLQNQFASEEMHRLMPDFDWEHIVNKKQVSNDDVLFLNYICKTDYIKIEIMI
ncbi:MAG: hypothetical protein Terrestrivirus1_268 [Terrestrivirus sp.]|uniref:Uncharacterized protein n=1 Tax=Terrestrivirus sp. TaxID=2487775 RepID=A0A3G4ZLV4_9VIRU|nr:MAG: hypothetical protein Terrestrivirus1_268 [Terrestrivirus sp.]